MKITKRTEVDCLTANWSHQLSNFSLHNWRHYAIEQGCAWNVSLVSENFSTGKLLRNISRGRTEITRGQGSIKQGIQTKEWKIHMNRLAKYQLKQKYVNNLAVKNKEVQLANFKSNGKRKISI